MMYNVYAIKDKKATFSEQLLLLPSDDLAKRHFSNLLHNLQTSTEVPLIVRYPEDFDLYCVGKYDCETGHLTDVHPEFIIGASSILKVGE